MPLHVNFFHAKLTSIVDYCIAYACHQDLESWEVKADACFCYNNELLQKIDAAVPKEFKR